MAGDLHPRHICGASGSVYQRLTCLRPYFRQIYQRLPEALVFTRGFVGILNTLVALQDALKLAKQAHQTWQFTGGPLAGVQPLLVNCMVDWLCHRSAGLGILDSWLTRLMHDFVDSSKLQTVRFGTTAGEEFLRAMHMFGPKSANTVLHQCSPAFCRTSKQQSLAQRIELSVYRVGARS